MKPRAFPILVCALAWALALAPAWASAEGSPVSVDFVARGVPALNEWELARKATAVVVGTVAAQEGRVTLTVTRTLKGKDVPVSISLLAGQLPQATAGKEWVVFLAAEGTGYRVLRACSRPRIPDVEPTIRDGLDLDALPTDRDKCRRLVELAIRPAWPWSLHALPSCQYASRELPQYNRAEFIDLLTPLAETHDPEHIQLLAKNPSPKAARLLLDVLERRGDADWVRSEQFQIIDALRVREPGSQALSAELAKHLNSEKPLVRETVIFALKDRAYRQATGQVLKCLDDPVPPVRAMAATWSWWACPDYRQRVLPKIRAMARDDPDDMARAAACSALVDLRDTRSFYLLWAMSLFGNNGTIRGAIHLDLMWEDSPVVVSLMLLWPTLLLAGVVGFVRWRFHARRLLLAAGIGLVCAYAVGAAGGYLLGKYHTSNPIFSATILTPPLVLPIGLLAGVLVWVAIRRAAARE